jgi:hypothetical protein
MMKTARRRVTTTNEKRGCMAGVVYILKSNY